MKKLSLILLFSLGALSAFAQQRITLDLQQTIALANDSSLEAFRTKNMYLAGYWEYRTYKANRLPSLTLNMTPAQYNRDITKRYDSEQDLDIYRSQQSFYAYGNLAVRQNFDCYLADYIPTVYVDKRQVAEKAASLFLEKNRKKVVQLVSSHTIKNYENEKEQLFHELLEKQGCEVVDISIGYNTFTAEGYKDAAERIFEECSDMDGIFGVDMAAIACLREAKLRKLKVPEELSIVSIDGTYITKLGPEILTSIVQPIEKMAKKLVSMIILQIEGKQVEEIKAIFDVEIQDGETC